MSRTRQVLIGLAIVAVLGAATTLTVTRRRDRGAAVRFDVIERMDLVETVTASGNIRAGRVVQVSSDVSARVAELLVDEGDDVTEGQVMLRLDPTQFDATVSRTRAALNQAMAEAGQQEVSLERATRDFERLRRLFERDSLLVKQQQLDDAKTDVDLASGRMESLEFGVAQADASLAEANERLSKTVFRAPISGKITRLNIEEGETVIVGTMNNAGTVVLTISELSRVEAVLEVDETDIPYIALGDSTILELDAFPDRQFSGVVTEIGNSAIRPPASTAGSGQTAAIDFEVVITMDDPPGGVRPDLSATADIVTAISENVLAVPIIALTVRAPDEEDEDQDAVSPEDENGVERSRGPVSRSAVTDVEGVFIVVDGHVTFAPVVVGITGQEHFEILSGINAGDSIVAGPYQQIRNLNDGDAVRAQEDEGTGSSR
jgi:HlyD family secretion protein